MAKPEWGLKRTCLSCGARFYDMQRDPIVCPTCETEFDPLALVRPRRARAAAASQAKAKAEAEKKPAEETAEESGDDLLANDDLEIENDDIDLGDDDDDLIADDDDDEIDDDPDVSEALGNAKEEGPNPDS